MSHEDQPVADGTAMPQQILTLKETIIPKLRELGVTKLTVNYSGLGDEGGIEGMAIEPEGSSIPDDLEKQIAGLAEQFLYCEHSGWDNGDGSTGTIVISPSEQKVVNEHGWCSSQVNYETKEY